MNYPVKFLWLPKRIDGKLHWLKKVYIVEWTDTMVVNGKLVVVNKREYRLIGGR